MKSRQQINQGKKDKKERSQKKLWQKIKRAYKILENEKPRNIRIIIRVADKRLTAVWMSSSV